MICILNEGKYISKNYIKDVFNNTYSRTSTPVACTRHDLRTKKAELLICFLFQRATKW